MHLEDKQQGAHRPGLTRAESYAGGQPAAQTHHPPAANSGFLQAVTPAMSWEMGKWLWQLEWEEGDGRGPISERQAHACRHGTEAEAAGRWAEMGTETPGQLSTSCRSSWRSRCGEGTRVHVGSPGLWYPGSSQPRVSTELQRRGKNFQRLKPITTTTTANPCRH